MQMAHTLSSATRIAACVARWRLKIEQHRSDRGMPSLHLASSRKRALFRRGVAPGRRSIALTGACRLYITVARASACCAAGASRRVGVHSLPSKEACFRFAAPAPFLPAYPPSPDTLLHF